MTRQSLAAVAVVLLTLALLFAGATLSFAKDKNKEKAAPAPAGDKIPLTADEAKDLEFNQLQIENLNFKIDALRKQIMTAQQNLAQDTQKLEKKFCDAHQVDVAAFRLDVKANALVPRPAPPAKPEAKPAKDPTPAPDPGKPADNKP
jgi:hypothetical protein